MLLNHGHFLPGNSTCPTAPCPNYHLAPHATRTRACRASDFQVWALSEQLPWINCSLGCDRGRWLAPWQKAADYLGKRSRSFSFQNLPVDVRGRTSRTS
jgi:hypothetical protein